MTTLKIQAVTEMGCVVYASIKVSNDYTMTEVANEIRRNNYTMFRIIGTMKRFARV